MYSLLILPIALAILALTLLDIRVPIFLLIGSLVISINGLETIKINTDLPDELLMLFSTLVFIFIIAKRWHSIKHQLNHPFIKIVIVIYLWSVIATIFSTDVALSVKFLLKKIWYLTPFLFYPILILDEKKNIKTVFALLFIPMILVIIYVLIKYNSLGFKFEDVHDPIQPFFINHVMYGAMISSFFPALIAALYLARRWSVQWMVLLIAVPVFLVAIYFSYSRAAWMAVVFAAGTFVLIKYKLMDKAILFFYGTALFFIFWLSANNNYLNYKPSKDKTKMHETILDHLIATIQGTDISSAERYYRWIATLRMSKDYMLTGVGPNNFYTNYKSYTITSFNTWVSRNPEKSSTHNYFLFMLGEQGLPALILYAFFIYYLFYLGQKIYHKQENHFFKTTIMVCLCVIGAIFVNNFFSDLLETNKIASLFFVSIAIMIALDKKQNMVKNQ
jgi:O-antigen ligase